jgi:histone deacetylase 1/2
MSTFNVPLLVLGGGGYTIRNVARCWTYETGCLLGRELEDVLPANDYSEYFGPTNTLHITPSNMENQNTREYIDGIRNRILENLSKLPARPGAPFYQVPPDLVSAQTQDMNIEPDLSEGEDRGGIYLDYGKNEDDFRVTKNVSEPVGTNPQGKEDAEKDMNENKEKSQELPDKDDI